MIKFCSFLILAIVISTNLIAQNMPSYLPTKGLVGYWPFNGNANDESGNGNHGTVNGAILTTDRNGIENSAYHFDGTNWIEVLNSNSIQPIDAFSISAWVLVEDTQPNGWYTRIVSKNHSEDQNFATYQLLTGRTTEYGKTGLAIRTSSGKEGYNWSGFSSNDISKTYQHIVGTFNGTELKFYQDGKLTSTIKHSGKLFYDSGNLWFGKGKTGELPGSDMFFNGKIDDIAIYNRALLEQEIIDLYTDNKTSVIPSYIPTNGLVGYWPFNGNAHDESGNGNDGKESKINYIIDREGKSNAAISFSQDKLSKIFIDEGVKNSKGLIKTFSVWFNFPKVYPKENYYNILVSAKGPILNYDSTSYQKEGDCMININGDLDPYPTLGYVNKISVQAQKPINQLLVNDSIWHHLIVEVNCEKNTIKEFFDGKLVQQYPFNYYPTSISDWDILTFGNNSRNCPECVFSGSLDDISIYNRALTEQEITELYRGCSHEAASLNTSNTFYLTTDKSVDLLATPKGGTFSGAAVKQGKFEPSTAKIGINKVLYSYKNNSGCDDITEFKLVVADTNGIICKYTDTVKVTKTEIKYDTITIKSVVYDTITVTDTVNILKINFKLTTGIKANQLTSLSIYPNPTSDVLKIEVYDVKALEDYRYRIVDAVGKEVYNGLITDKITDISMKSLGLAGMYQFEVLDSNNKPIQSNKIVLQ